MIFPLAFRLLSNHGRTPVEYRVEVAVSHANGTTDKQVAESAGTGITSRYFSPRNSPHILALSSILISTLKRIYRPLLPLSLQTRFINDRSIFVTILGRISICPISSSSFP